VRAESHLSPNRNLRLALVLPLRHRDQLEEFLEGVSNPSSPRYRQFLSTEQFTARFGPTDGDYARLIAYSQAHGFRVASIHPNRTLLEVEANAATVENAFRLHLGVYPHPFEARTFYAPDTEPSLDLDLPLLEIHGLHNFSQAQPHRRRVPTPTPTPEVGGRLSDRAGSGPNGFLLGTDFRQAYLPGSPLTGTGQSVGLFELDGYYASDITAYLALSKQSAVPLKNVLLNGFNGIPASRQAGSGNEEVALDIEMAMSMAPGLDRILVYEGSPKATLADINSVLNRMATDNLARQLSCSWGFDISATSQQIFQQYAAQGQSFFLASGDNGAFFGPVEQPSDDPYVITVGGTVLKTSGTRGWLSETAWSSSGGGISTVYPLPSWQQGISWTANQGSPTRRNVPDVAMVAMNVWVTADRGQSFALQGTSIAAPLWAGFSALINQQAAAQGQPPVGFLNPALYRLAQTSHYANSFHDVTAGNNFTSASPDLFPAVEGYDLCTGLGTPTGTNLIQALLGLAPPDSLVVSLPSETTFLGPVGGGFTPSFAKYELSTSASNPIPWSVSAPPAWLSLSPTNGTVSAGGIPSQINASLNVRANELLIGVQSATLWFTNLLSGHIEGRLVSLDVGNGGFESGDLDQWELDGDPLAEFADSIDSTFLLGSPALPGVDDSAFVHGGLYGAYIGETDRVGTLRQTLPTTAGRQYQISFWLTNPTNGVPNEFHCNWGDQVLFSRTNLDAFPWSFQQFVARANGTSTVLEFSFRHEPAAFGLDDIQIRAIPVPILATRLTPDGTAHFRWDAEAGLSYQVQFKNSLGDENWAALGASLMSNEGVLESQDTTGVAGERYYRVVTVP
jgi:hypothetical protein